MTKKTSSCLKPFLQSGHWLGIPGHVEVNPQLRDAMVYSFSLDTQKKSTGSKLQWPFIYSNEVLPRWVRLWGPTLPCQFQQGLFPLPFLPSLCSPSSKPAGCPAKSASLLAVHLTHSRRYWHDLSFPLQWPQWLRARTLSCLILSPRMLGTVTDTTQSL